MARKPSAIARELLRNFPKGRRRRGGRRRGRKQPADQENGQPQEVKAVETVEEERDDVEAPETADDAGQDEETEAA
jgi:hypothetical protein